MKAAIYLRVSTDEQAENYGLDMQRSKCEAYCALREWEVAEIYQDPGISGSTMERPGLQHLLEDARGDTWEAVVCYKVDRLSRSARNLLTICEDHLRPHGKDLASCMEGIDTKTPMGRFFLSLLGIFAEMERDTIRERMEGGKWEAARQGQWNARGVPFGYSKETIPDGRRGRKVLVIEEAEAQIVRQIYGWYTAEGIGPVQISQRLNSLGIPSPTQMRGRTRQARFWPHRTVHGILSNPVYCGRGYVHRTIGKTGKVRPEEEWIAVDVPQIISPALFQKASETRANNRRVSGGHNGERHSYLLRDVLFCGTCGRHLRGMGVGQGEQGRRYYRCGHSLHRIPEELRCRFPYVPAAALEKVVWQRVRAALLDPDLLEHYARLDEVSEAELLTQIASLEAREREISKERERLRLLFSKEMISFEELEGDLRRLEAQRREVEQAKAGFEHRLAQQQNLAERLESVRGALAELRGRVDVLTLEDRRKVLRDFGVKVTVWPDRAVQIDVLVPMAEGDEPEPAPLVDPHASVSKQQGGQTMEWFPRTTMRGTGVRAAARHPQAVPY